MLNRRKGEKDGKQKIRIRLKAYEHRTLDTAAAKSLKLQHVQVLK